MVAETTTFRSQMENDVKQQDKKRIDSRVSNQIISTTVELETAYTRREERHTSSLITQECIT